MYLKEIIFNGFKSFADRTKVELGPGVTTIVGPNGCGKSNIVDAIRWVLGEQSAKALRGGKMHDVIFAGTDTRAPLGMCEVTLTFSDCEKELGTAFNEVEITRRVSREGSSDYFLNGKSCRLKDIQQLFMDTGIGRVSYSFMVQGQIDQILSNNPAERRVIFEEAAGITRYKAQRREALNKLAQVDQNLSRVNDVVEEVGRQMGSLKRQASKAVRYKRLRHRMKHLELALSAFKFGSRKEVVDELDKRVEELRTKVSELGRGVTSKEEALETQKEERSGLYENLQAVQQEVYEIRSDKDQAENQAELSLVRKQDSEGRISQVEAEIKNIEQQIKELEEKAEDDAQVKQLQLNLVDSSDNVFKQRNQELEEIQSQLLEAEKDLQQKKRTLAESEGKSERLRSRFNDLEVELKAGEAKRLDIEERLQEARSKQAELEERLKSAQEKHQAQESVKAEKEKDIESAQENLRAAKESFRAIQTELQDQDRKVARLNAQVGILEDLQAKLEGFSSGAKAILKGDFKDILGDSSCQLLTKGIEVKEGYTQALETLLGSAVDAVALEEVDKINAIADGLIDKGLGRACLQIDIPNAPKFSSANAPQCLMSADEVISIKNSSMQSRWDLLLRGCYFSESLEEFISFWKENPSFNFLYVATQSGELIDSRGFVYVGRKSKKGKDSSFIEREKEIRVLKQEQEQENSVLSTLKEKADSAHKTLDAAEAAIDEARKIVQDINQELSKARVEQGDAQSAFSHNESIITNNERQLAQLSESRTSAEARRQEAQAEMSQATNGLDELKRAIQEAESHLEKTREERDHRREAISEVRIDLVEKKQRLDMIDQGLSEMRDRQQSLVHQQAQQRKEIDRLKDKIATYDQEAESSKTQAAELEKTLQERMSVLEEKREALSKIEETIKSFETELGDSRKHLHGHETDLKEDEVKLAKERSQINFLLEKAQTEYEVSLETVDWKQELWNADEEFEKRVNMDELDDSEDLTMVSKREHSEPTEEELAAMEDTDWSAVDSEVKQLRDRISSMGAVNLVAIEEYSELKERFRFLSEQCADLTSSKEQLLKAIDEINKTSQEMFVQTFQKVRENFIQTFTALFGGGHADLELQESEDILESGIEITARPPGTKLKGLSLLSGGQKTMTAVALLFAIYKVKPSPFCVLDELDAPLDDANIGRFTDMLRDFTKYSQFLVISHNKRTISASDTLYGVTMQERGVTRLVSMRLSQSKKTVEEAPKIESEPEQETVSTIETEEVLV